MAGGLCLTPHSPARCVRITTARLALPLQLGNARTLSSNQVLWTFLLPRFDVVDQLISKLLHGLV
jgi:hypothetical protein